MNQVDFLSLIQAGLPQPASEPEFFTYPVGYDLIATSTSYSLFDEQLAREFLGATDHAGLGSST